MDSAIRILTSFDFYYSLQFWAFLVAAVVLFRLLNRNKALAGWFMAGLSAAMILALPRVNGRDLLMLLCLALVVFCVGKALCVIEWLRPRPQRVTITTATVVLIVLVLMFFKYQFLQDLTLKHDGVFKYGIKNYLFIVGISYSSFRLIHFVVECHRGHVSRAELRSFLPYVFFFPAFISGPIHRYDDFMDQWVVLGNGHLSSDLKDGLFRIVNGLFKKLVLAEAVFTYSLPQVAKLSSLHVWQVILGIYCSTLFFYLDFSGYSDLAIGSAKLFGITLPENFRRPFVQPNIQLLWANWHMSLTQWLQEYVYWPLARRLRSIPLFRRNPVLLSNTCIVVTFAICGMWHGASLNFLAWGIYHGVGIACMNLYKSVKKRGRNARLKRYFLSSTSRVVGAFLTVHFFALGIVLFTLSFEELQALLARI